MPDASSTWSLRAIAGNSAFRYLVIASLALILGPMTAGRASAATPRQMIEQRYEPCQNKPPYYTFSHTKSAKVITHASPYEHFTKARGTYTKTAATQKVVSAGGTSSAGGDAGVDLGIIKFGAHAGVTVAHNRQHTTRRSIKITEQMTRYTTYVFYDGVVSYRAHWSRWVCNENTNYYFKYRYGKLHTYSTLTSGALACNTRPPKQTLAYLVKQIYC